MGLVTWTAVFQLESVRDTPEDVAQSINGLVGAQLQRVLRGELGARGWNFLEAWPEDYGWYSEAAVTGESKPLVVKLITAPEDDAAGLDGGVPEGRWRVVVGVKSGWLPGTKTQRLAILEKLAQAVEASCLALGATDYVWEEVGGRLA